MTAWHVTLDPPAVATSRVELDLNSWETDAGPIAINQTGIDWGQAQIDAFLADQVWGSSPVDYRVPNRSVTIPLFLGTGDYLFKADQLAAEETARAQLQQKVARLQAEGGCLLRQRDGGPPMYADIINTSLTIPDVHGETGGIEADVVLTLDCLPDFYGDEITLDTITATGHCKSVLKSSGVQAAIQGDYPSRVRVVVTDSSGNQQYLVLWAFRSRHYDPATTAALAYEAEALDPQSGSIVITTASGASGGHSVQSAALSSSWTRMLFLDIGGSTPFTHLGSYRVWARAAASTAADTFAVRLAWAPGDLFSPVTNDAVALPGGTDWQLVDLGEIRIDRPPIGATQWVGAIEALDSGGGTITIDQIFLQPIDEAAGYPIVTDESGLGFIAPSQGAEIRTEGCFTKNSTYYIRRGQAIGDLPRIPPSGLEGRAVELFVKPSRSDLANFTDNGLDSFTAQVIYRPCYLSRI